jgi:phosphomannomutase
MNASESLIDTAHDLLARLSARHSTQPRWLVERIGLFPSSGDIHLVLDDPFSVMAHLKQLYASNALDVDECNGLSLTFTEWRFNIRLCASKREVVLKVESRGDSALMQTKTAELLELIDERACH